MKNLKKLKFVLPSLVFVPLAACGAVIGSCAKAAEDLGPEAKKVTVYLDDKELKDQTEFDIKTTKKLQLSAKVEPAEARQDVTFEILAQEGTGNIACSATGIIYPNSCVGTITIRAVSKDKKAKSDPIELIFWDSQSIAFELYETEIVPGRKDKIAYVTLQAGYETIEDLCIPSTCTIKGETYYVNGVGYSAFNGCSELSYVRFPKNSDNFWYIGAYGFYLCDSIKKLTLPESVLIIDNGAFCNCTSLETVNLGPKVQYICANSFENCISLLDIQIPESVTYIGDSAFAQCRKVKDFYLSKNIRTIGEGAFSNCWDAFVTVDPESQFFCNNELAVYNHDKTRLLVCQYKPKTTVETGTFTVPKSVKRIDARAFEYCITIESVLFTDDSECESIGEEAFALCRNLSNFKFPKNLPDIKTATFSCCWILDNIDIPASVQYIGKHAFYGCDRLNSVHFQKDDSSIENEQVTWTLINTSVEPKLAITNFNVEQSGDPEGRKIDEFALHLSNKLALYGHYKDPENPKPEDWIGGFTNCIWTKNSIPVKCWAIPTDTGIGYVGYPSINRGANKFKARFVLTKEVLPETGLVIDLVNTKGGSLTTDGPKAFHGEITAEGEEKVVEFNVDTSSLTDVDQVVVKIYKA